MSHREKAVSILEIGLFHGKNSANIAAALEKQGKGHLTTPNLESARARQPNTHRFLDVTKLSNRITPIYFHRSLTWELHRMINADAPPIRFLLFQRAAYLRQNRVWRPDRARWHGLKPC